MNPPVNRRQFLTTSATAAAALSLPFTTASANAQGKPAAPPAPPPTFKTKLLKATTGGQVNEETLRQRKDLGFDGMEGRVVPVEQAAAMRKVADKLGMRVPSVLYGWARFNSPDPGEQQRTFAGCEDALRTAQAYGADAALIVTGELPARTAAGRGGGIGAPTPFKMPDPWEVQIDFDEKTGLIRRVVVGDNAPYAEYIKLHNHAIQTSTEWTKKLIPLAEKTKVVIAIENVWNNLWLTPEIFRHFIASFNSPWVQAYYDIGNNIKWAPPEQWVLTLGGLLNKVHVKDFKLDPMSPTGNGDWAAIRDGSTRWPVLRAALDRVNYNGWLILESPQGLSLAEQAKRLDMIMAGI